jgi:hypothetical protein
VFHGSGEVIPAAETDYLVKEVRVFEGEVGGMIGAQGAAGGYDRWIRVYQLYETENIGEDIVLIFQMAGDAFRREYVFGVETFFVDAVETKDLKASAVDLFVQRIDDLPVLIVIEAGGAGGEEEHRLAGMTEDQQFHISAKVFTKPFVVFSFHGIPVDR